MKKITKGIPSDAKGIAVGAHFAEDGNTWIGQGYGAEVIQYADGRIEINAGCQHEEYGYICNEEESAAIRKMLFPEADSFVRFVLRHTWPERVKAHGAKVVHDLIRHHPFAKMFMPKDLIELKPPAETAEGLLREAASKFRFYQSQHEQKYRDLENQEAAEIDPEKCREIRHRRIDTHEKARVNAEIASRIEAYLAE